MKKFFYSALAATMLFACSQEEIVDVTKGEGQKVTFKVEIPSVESRTVGGIEIGAGTQANTLIYAMYENGGNATTPLISGVVYDNADGNDDGEFTVTVPMAKDLTYDLLFLAYNETNSAFEIETVAKDTDLKNLRFKANQIANIDAFDAFVGAKKNQGVNDPNEVTLKRPFAQVNAATTEADLDYAELLKLNVFQSKLVIKDVPEYYNVLEATASGSVEVTYAASAIMECDDADTNNQKYPNEMIEVDGTNYYYLTLAYVLAGEVTTTSTHNATFEFQRENGQSVSTLEIVSLPIQRNYRTNVIGDLLTKSEQYTIKIDADFEVPTKDVNLWDGKTLKEPAYDATTQTYSIYNAAELAYIAALVNGTLNTDNVSREAVSANSLKGVTISLEDDIYLNNEEWTPIGYGSNHFQGTLEGKYHTIYGLKVTQRRDTRAALFGTVSGTIAFKNLTFKGASIECPDFNGDFYGSALIGTAYGNVTIENVDVVDSYISGNNKVGALLAHDGVVSSLKINDCDISNVKFEATNTEDGGSVGGLVGYFQGQAGGEYKIEDSTVKDCTFNVVNSTNTGKRANGLLMGGLDSKANQVLYITDCTAEYKTWNEKFYVDGTEVTERAFRSLYNGLIGGERNDEQEGKVIIDGTEYPHSVAKVGNTDYYFIDDAIANWTNKTTLTLLGDVTLSDVIKLSSTEHHILDLGTYTMTGAKGKNAIEIINNGRSSASYALDIKADATNPGGITASSAVVKTTGKSGVKDRPIIRFYNGVFNANNIINHGGSTGTNSPQFIFYNGVYNGSISTNRAICIFEGGTFNGRFFMSVDSSSYARIGGGKFKYMDNLYGSALNSEKFTIGSAKGVFDRGVYVDDEGYIVVGGPVITEFGDKFAAKAKNASKAGSYLPYSSAAEYGLYYTNADMAIAKHGEANVDVKQ